MTTLQAETRDMSRKAKALRREGWVPGIICGHEMESTPIQVAKKDAEKFIKENQKGGQVQVVIGKKKHSAILKDYTFDAMKKQVEVMDFQELVKGEKIHTTVEIVLKNEELAGGCVNQELSEIHYKATPENLLETIVLDFEKLSGVKEMKVGDIEELKGKKIDLTTSKDALIFAITEGSGAAEAVDEDEDTPAAPEAEA